MSPKGVEHHLDPQDPPELLRVHSSMSPKGVEHRNASSDSVVEILCAFINVAERR